MKKHPILIGVCNAVVPGLGYLIIGERKVFGWLLLGGTIACFLVSFIDPAFQLHTLLESQTVVGKVIESIWYLLYTVAFGYDAWDLANKKHRTETIIAVPASPNV